MFSKSESTSKQGNDSSNLFQERGDDVNQQASLKDTLKVEIGPITMSKNKRIQEELIGLILDIQINKL